MLERESVAIREKISELNEIHGHFAEFCHMSPHLRSFFSRS
jgi:hypothetical protein